MPILAPLSGLAEEIRSTYNILTLKLSSYWLLVAAAHLILSFFLQIKKKSIDKAKQEERTSKEFAAMEEAALKAYQEDLKRMEREEAGNFFVYFTELICSMWATQEELLLFDILKFCVFV